MECFWSRYDFDFICFYIDFVYYQNGYNEPMQE